ncbi:MAG: fibronectin type III domain-containing protein, partial [Thermoguttaceae bacterium]|nr:fibronectin type III domain-containing protein [Thermoguttaceae bacterium]
VENYDATQGKATLRWAATMESLTGYRVEISTVPFASSNASGSSSSCQVYVVGDVSSCDFKVAAGSTYYCRVRSYDDTGSSTWSETTFKADATPASPTGLNFTRYNSDTSGTYVRLRWTDASNNETGFRVEYKASNSSSWTLAETTKANATGVLVYGVEPGVKYQWRVRSERGDLASAWTEGSFYALSSPKSLSVKNYDATQGKATLTWAATMEPLTGYRVEISTVPFTSSNASGSSSKCQVYVVGDVSSCDFKVAAGTTYYCRVRSYGDTGSSVWSETTFKAKNVVSNAFADLFADDDAEDDFWFELDKVLGVRR